MQSASTMITPIKKCVLYTDYGHQIQCYSFIIIILSGGKASVIQFLRTLKGHSQEMFYHSIYGALWRGYNGFWEIFYIYKYFEFNLFSSLSNPLFSNAKSLLYTVPKEIDFPQYMYVTWNVAGKTWYYAEYFM